MPSSAPADRIRMLQELMRSRQPQEAPPMEIPLPDMDEPLPPMDMPTQEEVNTPVYQMPSADTGVYSGAAPVPAYSFSPPPPPSNRQRIAAAHQSRRRMQQGY